MAEKPFYKIVCETGKIQDAKVFDVEGKEMPDVTLVELTVDAKAMTTVAKITLVNVAVDVAVDTENVTIER